MFENDWDFTPAPEEKAPEPAVPATLEPVPTTWEPQQAACVPEPAAYPSEPTASIPEPAVLTPQIKPKKKRRAWPRVLALVLCCALVGTAAGAGGAMLYDALGRGGNATVIYQGSGSPEVINLHKIGEGQILTPAEVYAANSGSVVGITTQITTNVWGRTVAGAASGSGFVLTADGYIVTNYHVIEDATSITVQFKNGDTFPAKLVGGEENNDVAVLKIDAENLTPVRLGASTDLVVGEQVAAIGNPLGEMTFSMTVGYVSALDKPLTMSDGSVINVLQTDASINSGNSGGPLFNMYGQVVGITNAKYSNNGSTNASIEGICFAIPIDDVKAVLTDIIEHGYVTGKPYLGATLSTADAAEAKRYGRSGGARVEEITPGAAADQAGLQEGDIITKMDDAPIDSWQTFLTQRDRHRSGDTVTLTVDRAGQFIEIKLTFDEQPSGYQSTQSAPQSSQSGSGDSGSGSGGSGNNRGGNGYGYDWDFEFDPYNWFGW